MPLIISVKIEQKLLQKHDVTREMVIGAIANRSGKALTDTREGHKTSPPTMWFISETDKGVRLKICFVIAKNGDVYIKTAYRPNQKEENIYAKYC